ncbi:unnamed protein product, partial [Mesorhabditis spiculigera]
MTGLNKALTKKPLPDQAPRLIDDAPYPVNYAENKTSTLKPYIFIAFATTIFFFCFVAPAYFPSIFKQIGFGSYEKHAANENERYDTAFFEFMKEFDRHYKNRAEFNYRHRIFMQNMKEWEAEEAEDLKNGGNLDLDINQFADYTKEEMAKMLMSGDFGPPVVEGAAPIEMGRYLSKDYQRPASKDWVQEGKVTAVKNQGQCGSCWSFATVATVESAVAIKRNNLDTLSEQELVDCEHDQGGCNGGYRPYAYRWIKENGLVQESGYPYVAQVSGQCRLDRFDVKTRVYIDDYQMLSKDEGLVADWVAANGPVSFGMKVTKDLFHYKSGVFRPNPDACAHESQGSHALTIVGYGSENGQDYWLVKNSWGNWGLGGYFKLARGINACGMAETIVAPVVRQ